MNYLTARNAFLQMMGPLTPEERKDAIAAFDLTFNAHVARLMDAWAQFWENFK